MAPCWSAAFRKSDAFAVRALIFKTHPLPKFRLARPRGLARAHAGRFAPVTLPGASRGSFGRCRLAGGLLGPWHPFGQLLGSRGLGSPSSYHSVLVALPVPPAGPWAPLRFRGRSTGGLGRRKPPPVPEGPWPARRAGCGARRYWACHTGNK